MNVSRYETKRLGWSLGQAKVIPFHLGPSPSGLDRATSPNPTTPPATGVVEFLKEHWYIPLGAVAVVGAVMLRRKRHHNPRRRRRAHY